MGEISMLLNKYKVETYTFSEYKNLVTMENLNKFDRVIAHIKKNKSITESMWLFYPKATFPTLRCPASSKRAGFRFFRG